LRKKGALKLFKPVQMRDGRGGTYAEVCKNRCMQTDNDVEVRLTENQIELTIEREWKILNGWHRWLKCCMLCYVTTLSRVVAVRFDFNVTMIQMKHKIILLRLVWTKH